MHYTLGVVCRDSRDGKLVPCHALPLRRLNWGHPKVAPLNERLLTVPFIQCPLSALRVKSVFRIKSSWTVVSTLLICYLVPARTRGTARPCRASRLNRTAPSGQGVATRPGANRPERPTLVAVPSGSCTLARHLYAGQVRCWALLYWRLGRYYVTVRIVSERGGPGEFDTW